MGSSTQRGRPSPAGGAAARLAEARHVRQPRAHVVAQRRERGRRAVEARDGAEVHVRRAALAGEERRVQGGQGLEVVLGHRRGVGYGPPWPPTSLRRPSSSPGARPGSAAPPRRAWPATAGRSTRRARHVDADRRPRARRAAGCSRSTSPTRRRWRPRSRAVEDEAGAVGVAGQQRRLQPVGRDRDRADGRRPAPVRDERLRARPDVPARAARDARPGLGADRQHLLDGRQARSSRAAASTTPRSTRWRRLSDALRFEVAGFGVDVVVIEPGLIRTGFADAADDRAGGRDRRVGVRRVQRAGRARHARGLREGADEGAGRRGR